MRLDGPGYARALQALKEEFPYYIRSVEFETLPDWLGHRSFDKGAIRPTRTYRRHAETDSGHVRPGQTNADLGGVTDLSRRANGSVAACPPASGASSRPPSRPPSPRAAVSRASPPAGPPRPRPRAGSRSPIRPNSRRSRARRCSAGSTTSCAAPSRSGLMSAPRAVRLRRTERIEDMTPADFGWKKFTDMQNQHGSRASEKFTEWLIDDATPAEQHKVIESIIGRQRPGRAEPGHPEPAGLRAAGGAAQGRAPSCRACSRCCAPSPTLRPRASGPRSCPTWITPGR